MKKFLVLQAAVLTFVLALTMNLPKASAEPFPSVADLKASNVAIQVVGFDFTAGLTPNQSGKPDGNGLGLVEAQWVGSGFLVEPDGTLLTNYHVARRAMRVQAVFDTGATFDIPFIKVADPKNDIAILKVGTGDHSFPVVRLGDSDDVEVMDRVLAVGNPLGMGINVTEGMVSQIVRDNYGNRFSLRHTATIAPGNSGGALYKGKKVVGINVRGVPPYEFYEAIPINKAKPLIRQYYDQRLLWSEAFPTNIEAIINKASQVWANNGVVPAATSSGAGQVSYVADLYGLEDAIVIIEAQEGFDLAVSVWDQQSGNLVGYGDLRGDTLDAVLLANGVSYRNLYVTILNYQNQPANFGVSFSTINW